MTRREGVGQYPSGVGTQTLDRSSNTGQTNEPLIAASDSSSYSERWGTIQTKFVDDPQTAVREADGLVVEITDALTSKFAQQRQELEHRWDSGGDVSTEDLRQALQQYRTFFQRLLTI
jgi:hypothetical protein